MPPVQNRSKYPARLHPPAAGHADMEARSRAEMPVVPDTAILASGAHDPVDGGPSDDALRLGASGRRALRAEVRRGSNREQVNRVAARALKRGKFVDVTGYWRRHAER
jgi:hypothetical protein